MFIYVAMAVNGAIALIWRIKLSEMLFLACAPIGAMFTAVTLITGMLWGKPTWGAYWVWDARLTSELVLLFLYFGVIGLASAYDDLRQGARAAAVLALVGVVNVPIIHFSVKWWNTLHQGETVRVFGKSSIDGSMLWPLLIMALATKLYFMFAVLMRARHAAGTGARQALGARTGERRSALMLAWLENQGHWGFIWLSLVVTLVLVLADLLPPLAAPAPAPAGNPRAHPPRTTSKRVRPCIRIRRRRLFLILGLVVGIGAATGLALVALQENVNHFYSPSEVASAARRKGATSASAGWCWKAARAATAAR